MPARSTLVRALAFAVPLLLVATTAAAQRTTAPVDRPRVVRDPTVRLPKPEALTVVQLSSTSLRLSWKAVEGAKYYLLGRSIGTNGLQRVDTPRSLQTEYVDSDVRVGVRVSYAVTAIDSSDQAGLRAMTPDFIPVAMAPTTVATVPDSTASDSTKSDSTATPPATGGSSGAPGGSTSVPAVHTASGCPPGSLSTGTSLDGRGRSAPPTRDRPPTVDAKLDHGRIVVQWRTTERDIRSWEVWDQIDGIEHFAVRLPASAGRFDLNVARAGIHVPMLFYTNPAGYAGPVCPRGIRVSDEILAGPAPTNGSGGATPGSSSAPTMTAPADVGVENGAPLTVKVRESVPVADKILAREWLSLDPDIATVGYGTVRGVKGGVARIVGLTTNLDGTIRMNLVRVTVTAEPPPHRKP